MTADEHDDNGRLPPLTVELEIDGADLARRVRAMLAGASDITVVVGDWPPAQVRITVGSMGLHEGEPALLLAGGDGADAQHGTTGIVSPRIDAAALRAAIRAAAQGLAVFSPGFGPAAIDDHRDTAGLARAEDEPVRADLTPRELQVLRLMAEGASNKVIARRLAITPHTAKFHVASIIAKLGATGRTDAVARAMRSGLVMI